MIGVPIASRTFFSGCCADAPDANESAAAMPQSASSTRRAKAEAFMVVEGRWWRKSARGTAPASTGATFVPEGAMLLDRRQPPRALSSQRAVFQPDRRVDLVHVLLDAFGRGV